MALALRMLNEAKRDPRLWTADQFLDFYVARPDGERWHLIDGLPMMMTPTTRMHQRISFNLERDLNDVLERVRPDLFAYASIGIRIAGVDDFHPEPDLVICSSEADRTYYSERFLFVAEVISPSNTAEMIERKLELYRSHPDNLYCLTVGQDSVHVTLFAREGEVWNRTDLTSLDDKLVLPTFDFEVSLADIYKGTPLAG